jgi:hypothetical protein
VARNGCCCSLHSLTVLLCSPSTAHQPTVMHDSAASASRLASSTKLVGKGSNRKAYGATRLDYSVLWDICIHIHIRGQGLISIINSYFGTMGKSSIAWAPDARTLGPPRSQLLASIVGKSLRRHQFTGPKRRLLRVAFLSLAYQQ